jgi:2-iminobutanoate/2-iminopropanoate deaminase
MRSQITTPGVPKPSGPYSNAIVVNDLVFVAGQGPFDEDGRLTGATFEEQLTKTIDNIERILVSAGSGLDNVVKMSVFLRHIANRPTLNSVLAERLVEPFPARTTVPVDLNGFEVEIDVVAFVPTAR